MLYRKIASEIEDHLKTEPDVILLIDGARQVGKTYIVRYIAGRLFRNFIEINLADDYNGERVFGKVRTTDDFYTMVSSFAGDRMGKKEDTLIFLDEIQTYPHLITMLKFLQQDGRFTYIASGSLLGVTLSRVPSIPMGSIETIRMYPMDLEEFLIANGVGKEALDDMREKFLAHESLNEGLHTRILDLFKRYLIVGGLPEAVKIYVEEKNIQKIRRYQTLTHNLYAADSAQYDSEHKLRISRIYNLIPSNLENKKKRVVINDIEPERPRANRFSYYADEFDYLVSAGIALDVKAVSTPVFPLSQTMTKNLVKLYMSDVGLLTNIFYGTNIQAVLYDEKSINLGSVYECVTACELAAHGFDLFYYDNKSKGEVDFLIDDHKYLCALPLEIKSGKDYTVHSSLSGFVSNEDYNVKHGIVFSNNREVRQNGKIIYLPIYDLMFIEEFDGGNDDW